MLALFCTLQPWPGLCLHAHTHALRHTHRPSRRSIHVACQLPASRHLTKMQKSACRTAHSAAMLLGQPPLCVSALQCWAYPLRHVSAVRLMETGRTLFLRCGVRNCCQLLDNRWAHAWTGCCSLQAKPASEACAHAVHSASLRPAIMPPTPVWLLTVCVCGFGARGQEVPRWLLVTWTAARHRPGGPTPASRDPAPRVPQPLSSTSRGGLPNRLWSKSPGH